MKIRRCRYSVHYDFFNGTRTVFASNCRVCSGCQLHCAGYVWRQLLIVGVAIVQFSAMSSKRLNNNVMWFALLLLISWQYFCEVDSFSTCKSNRLTGIFASPRRPLLRVAATAYVALDDGTTPLEIDKDSKIDDVPSSSDVPMSMAAATFGLVKAMVGSGLLALASGLAAVTNYPAGLYPAHILIVVLGIISAYTFSLYGRLTHATQARTLGEIWKRIYTDDASSNLDESKRTGMTVSLASFVFCFGACIAYSLTFGDMCSSFFHGIGLPFPAWALSRQASILAVTATVVLPLCRLSSLTALAPASIVGVVGTIITIAFLAFRCPAVVAGSPYKTIGAGMLAQVTQQPSFSTYSRLSSPAPLILIAMACASFMAHFSAPDFYHSLSTKTTGLKSEVHANAILRVGEPTVMQRFNQMTVAGYSGVMMLNVLALTFGFLTFGGASNGIILNNYNTADWGANISRLFVGISVVGSYPFVMSGCRAAALELLSSQSPEHQQSPLSKESNERNMTTMLLSIVTAISLFVKDAGFVVGFNGALMGSTIAFTFPALLFLKLNEAKRRLPTSIGRLLRAELWFCRTLVGFGIVSAVVGGATTVVSSFFPYLLT
jgi:solute carrier family 38 (sodium-coupled neutral amino acid transporter), member 11